MISNEEMYEFASQIAGITDSDLQQYKCGGKTKKKACGGKTEKNACGSKMKKSQSGSVLKNIKNKYEDMKMKAKTIQQQDSLRREKQNNPQNFNKNGSRKYDPKKDNKTNENWRPGK